MKKLFGVLAGAVMAFGLSFFNATTADAATYTFVGSWQVDQGPSWTVVPTAYSGQDAAALLFGGNAADYAISTVDNVAANIDFQAWVSVWFSSSFGYCGGANPCGIKVAENFVASSSGLYANPGDTSAYVTDWATGSEYTNYAFTVSAVPLPAALPLFASGIVAFGAYARRRGRKVRQTV